MNEVTQSIEVAKVDNFNIGIEENKGSAVLFIITNTLEPEEEYRL